MSTTEIQKSTGLVVDVEDAERIRQFVYREARLLDDWQFDQWLECYHPDAEFWMPAWDVDDTLTKDPQNDISLIWYPNRSGLEDRVFRIKTDRSAATSIPEPRTEHNIGGIEFLERRDDQVEIRFSWTTHYYRYHETLTYYGHSFYTLDIAGDSPLILGKKVILKNDRVHHLIDIYMI
ncbi:benzoate 1,2-dioxygenase small subunit [Nesterenkonia cremea]|uniref:Benzoate 1,2-dioxygenase small subunit n=1 Tax=Nesterenkonia cremea TaxID=1882340 RepID=A0A917ET18_9MICC|nr:benzoate 1,2-dioxygenase small subunit [Nesterenkonia cremea]GGE76906.1 benzoate 1,2-dioxygenase small subunit [Nesterenkonia cremea]